MKDKGIEFALIHGSYLEHKKYRDIDVAIFLKEDALKSEIDYYKITLAVKLDNKINKTVDISILNKSSYSFKFQTLKGKIIFIRNIEFYDNYVEEVLRNYYDFQFIRERMLEEV